MSGKRHLASTDRRFLRLRKSGARLERAEADERIRESFRRDDRDEVYSLALRHPLRPFLVESKFFQSCLRQSGFILIPWTFGLMLPPEGMSRREAKKIRDRLFREHTKKECRKLQRQYQGDSWDGIFKLS